MKRYNAYEVLLSSAKAGNYNDQCDLAGMLWWGGGDFPKDLKQSRYWYGQAAKTGNKKAQYNVGVMLVEGVGGQADKDEGIKYLEMAAAGDDGDTSAAMELASLHENGLHDVEIDLEKVCFWEARSADFRMRDLRALKVEEI